MPYGLAGDRLTDHRRRSPMSRDLGVVLVSAVVATVNPSLLAATTAMLLLPNPKRLMLGYLLGAYTTSVAAGLAIVFSLHGSSAVRTSTHLLSPGGNIVVGAIALSVAFVLATGRDARLRRWRERRKEAHAANGRGTEPWQTRMLARGSVLLTFVVGAAMSFPGVSYVNALDHIAALNPPTISILLLVAYFCVMQQIVLEGALIASTVAPNRTQHVIVAVKQWFAHHGRQVAMVGLSAMGVLLAAHGVVGVS
jgi:Sap, sulfolipid-1-addressing protein